MKKESHQIMGQDMLDYSSTSKIYEEVKKYLTGPVKFYDILNISQENLKLWLEKQLSTKFTVQKSKYITKKLIKNLADTVEKELFEIIN